MASYKLFLIRDGKPVRQIMRELPDDLAALDSARALCREHAIEVYEENRLVVRVKQGDEPLNVSDPPAHVAGTEKPQA